MSVFLAIPAGLVLSWLLHDEAVREHDRLTRIKSQGVPVIGGVLEGRAPWRNKGWSKVEVELAGRRRIVTVSTRLALGRQVGLLCDPASAACETTEFIEQHLKLWPFTPLAILWGLALAVCLCLPVAALIFPPRPRR